MKRIGPIEFPTTEEEADKWKPSYFWMALHSKVLLVAKTRIEGEWACYCTPVPGKNHDIEIGLWQEHGTKVGRSIARAAFPHLLEIPYAS